ncbi:MAG TPA: cupredoxin family protein [Vicinamibacterales bacterium]|nr:cupredoxin family protein [Vicinamibacterales bacterium]
MKQAVRWVVLAAAVAAGPTLAHSDAHPPKKNAEIKQTEFGRTGDPRKASRTVKVDMSDAMRFTPAEISVRRGETVRFVATNSGKQVHEMVLGTMKELKEHAELMRKHPGMEHDEPYMAHVQPGKTVEIVWQFTKPGEFHYGCLIPGHFEAGMNGKVTVKP